MKQQVVIATISWARNKKEEKIVLKALQELNKLGLPIVLTDESRSKFPIFNKARRLKNFRVFRANGLDAKVRKSLFEASHIGQFIFYTESDKLNFIRNHMRLFLNKFFKRPAGIWLPARLPMNFDKLPHYQKAMEYFLGDSFGALAGIEREDISYGPRIFPASLIKYLIAIKSKIGWGWQTYLLIIGQRLRLPIKIVKFNVYSPIDVQQNKELVLFRIEQAIDELRGLQLGSKIKL